MRADTKLRYLLMSSDQSYLRPQKHDKERIRPLKNITYIIPLENQNTHAKDDIRTEQPKSSKPQLN